MNKRAVVFEADGTYGQSALDWIVTVQEVVALIKNVLADADKEQLGRAYGARLLSKEQAGIDHPSRGFVIELNSGVRFRVDVTNITLDPR